MCNFAGKGRDATVKDVNEAMDFIIDHNNKCFQEDSNRGHAIININALGSFFHSGELNKEVRSQIYKRIRDYAEGEAKGKNVVFINESRIDHITEEKMKEMREGVGDNVIIDIGVGIESTDDLVRESIINKGLPEDWKERLEIVTIGVYDDQKNKGAIYFQAPDKEVEDFQDESFQYKVKTEKEMLEDFWQGVKSYKDFVSFNGRSFDVPFLMIRSAVNKVKPSIDLMFNRYLRYQSVTRHIDLFDQLSFYGAVRRRGNLHLYCNAFGIKSPKASGVSGDDVNELFNNQEYKKIAEYNSWDLIATAELYERWRNYMVV